MSNEDIKIFNIWSLKDVKISDEGLVNYINLKPILVPHTSGRYEKKKFWKSKMSIVERLINKLMTTGHRMKKHLWTSHHNTGRVSHTYKIVKDAFKIIEQKTQRNPIQVLIDAIENTAPRQELTFIEYGGIRHPKAVDVSPQRRVDLSLRWITQGAYHKAVNSKISMAKALADEILMCVNNDSKAFAVSRKNELERQAAASK